MLYILYALYSVKRFINILLFNYAFLTEKEESTYLLLRWRIIGPKRFANMLTIPILRNVYPKSILSELVSVEPIGKDSVW